MRVLRAGASIIIVASALTLMFTVTASSQVIVNPDATIVVANLNPVQGESVEIHNADNDDSTCEGGTPVVFVNGLPPGILSQLVGEPDANGDWSVTMHVPFQSDWPSNYVLGPYTLEASCFADTAGSAEGVDAAAEPEFAYVPVVVTVNVPVAPSDPVAEPAAALVVTPAFTG
jgi:hypothetical protein